MIKQTRNRQLDEILSTNAESALTIILDIKFKCNVSFKTYIWWLRNEVGEKHFNQLKRNNFQTENDLTKN